MVPNLPIFKALSALRGAKIAQQGLKMGSFHLFVHSQIVQKYLWKNTFWMHFSLFFGPKNNPFPRHFVTLEGPKWLAMGSRWAHFTYLCIQNGLCSFLEKHIFDPFLTHFWSQSSPFSRHFVTLEGPNGL